MISPGLSPPREYLICQPVTYEINHTDLGYAVAEFVAEPDADKGRVLLCLLYGDKHGIQGGMVISDVAAVVVLFLVG